MNSQQLITPAQRIVSSINKRVANKYARDQNKSITAYNKNAGVAARLLNKMENEYQKAVDKLESSKLQAVYKMFNKAESKFYSQKRQQQTKLKKEFVSVEMPIIFEEQQCILDYKQMPLVCHQFTPRSIIVENIENQALDEISQFADDIEFIVNSVERVSQENYVDINVFGVKNINSAHRKEQRQKLQKRNQIINKQVKDLNALGIETHKIGDELVITKSQKLPQITAKDLDFDQFKAKIIYHQLMNKFKLLQLQVDKLQPTIKRITSRGFNFKWGLKKGRDIIYDDQPKNLVSRYLNDANYYDREVNQEVSLVLQLSTGLIGAHNNLKQVLDNYLFISPYTKTRCIPDCVAIIQFVNQNETAINLFAWVKTQSEKIARQYELIGGGSMADLQKIAVELNFPIYEIGDEITQVGVIVSEQHCICVLPKNIRNQMIAEELQRQYHDHKDQVIQIDRDLFLSGPDTIYLAYDFEWTYDRKQLENRQPNKNSKEQNIVDQFVYAVSYYIFEGLPHKPKNYHFGVDSAQWFVNKLVKIADRYPNKKIVCYAHNGEKADYPLIQKLLLNVFRKDFQDFASQMTTLSFNWNIKREKNRQQIISFQNSFNLLPGSLEQVGKAYGCKSKKLECKHDEIYLDNWQEQIILQKVKRYVLNDTLVLGQALSNYSDIIEMKYGFPILKFKNILSNSSLANNAFFYQYYDETKCPIYKVPDDFENYAQQAFHGGSCSMFIRGYLREKFIFAIDINSSYPGQMRNHAFPTGPYYMMDLLNIKYNGQQLVQGLYLIYIKDSPMTQFPVFFTKIDGQSQPSIIRNTQFWVTSVEIEYAYQQGYTDIYLIQGILSQNSTRPFQEFIDDHYQQRCEYKKEMKKYPEGSSEWNKYNTLQSIAKQQMNSVYGKFALASTRDVSQEITSNSDMILNMLKDGCLTDYKVLDNTNTNTQFYQVGGITSLKTTKSNMIIAAFITAYGRIQLNKIQRDCDQLGLSVIYSDTDSVYFMCDHNKFPTNKQKNDVLDKLSNLHCHSTRLGACKFETDEDIGNCLKQFNALHPDQEPLRYPFADEIVTLALKSYALRNTFTDRYLLKGKGIPEWMMSNKTSLLSRAQWNGNERQFVFDDFIQCSINNKPFVYNAIQFSARKSNINDDQKEHTKDGLKMEKKVGCYYNQKIVAKSGKCIPKILNSHHEITLPTSYDQQFDGEGYISFSNTNEIKAHFNLEDDDAWDLFKSSHVVIRNGDNNKFLVFNSFQDFREFFNETIVKQKPRNYHLLNSKSKQQLAFDIDCKDIEYIREAEIDLSQDSIEQQLREMFNLPESVKCEIVDRCREGKISYHVRFNILATSKQIKTIIHTNEEMDVHAYLDLNMYHGQLRITQLSDEFLFNPDLFLYNFKMTKKQIELLQRQEVKFSTNNAIQTLKSQQDSVSVQQYLYEFKLNKAFKYRDTQSNPNSKNAKTIRLKHIHDVEYNCQQCQRKHTNDNCIFIDIRYDCTTKKEIATVKCFKHLSELKDNKLKQPKTEEVKTEEVKTKEGKLKKSTDKKPRKTKANK